MKICINVRLGGNWYFILLFRGAGGGKLTRPKCFCLWKTQCFLSIWPDLLLTDEWWTNCSEFLIKLRISVGLLPLKRGRPAPWREGLVIRKSHPADREQNICIYISVCISVIYRHQWYVYISTYLPLPPFLFSFLFPGNCTTPAYLPMF